MAIKDPRDILRTFIGIFESVFEQDDIYGVPNTQYKYKKTADGSDTARDSALVIAGIYTEELEVQEPRPMLIISLGSIRPMGIGGIHQKLWGMNTAASNYKAARMCGIELQINAVARNKNEAYDLGLIVMSIVSYFADDIRTELGAHTIDDPILGPAALIKGGARADLFSVPVNLNMQAVINWLTKHTELTDYTIDVNVATKEE